MRLKTWWQWWRALPQNPIYQRERGAWGKSNPFYDTLTRYSPFVVMGTLLFGVCMGGYSPTFFGGNDDLVITWCLICIPNFLLSALTLYGSLMLPALTAPSISLEVDRGTWDILRMTPQSGQAIILAKMLGAMGRLRVWPLLLGLSVLQGAMIACALTAISEETSMFLGVVMGISAVFRPFIELLLAATWGMIFSITTRSATMALVGSYTGIVLFKLFNSSVLWSIVLTSLGADSNLLLAGTGLGGTAVYATVLFISLVVLLWQAEKISNQ